MRFRYELLEITHFDCLCAKNFVKVLTEGVAPAIPAKNERICSKL